MSSFRETWRQMHKPQFWVIMLGACAWVALGVWLQVRIGWPDRYGFHCHGRTCLPIGLWYSPRLLRTHTLGECAFFLWLWSLPAFLLAFVLWSRFRKRGAADLPPPDRL